MPALLLPPPLEQPAVDALLQVLLDSSATGIAHLRPLYAAAQPGELADFCYERLNPAAQRLLGLPEQPAASLRTLVPHEAALFAFYRDTFLAGAPGHYSLPGSASTVRVVAQRHGPYLVASFSEVVAEAEPPKAQLAGWQLLLEQAPVAIAVLRGPAHRIELANPVLCALWNRQATQLLGKPLLEAIPEAAGQPLAQQLTHVLTSGKTLLTHEQPSLLTCPGQPGPKYVNVVYQPLREATGELTGVVVVVTDVSEQVQARRCVQQLNEELRLVNEQLRTANQELHANNHELAAAQQKLQQLNQELECRVAQGVQKAQQVRDAAEQQRQRLARFFQQAPAAICVLDGPELVYELANPVYQRFFPDRPLLGRPLHEAAPELVAGPMYQWLREVYDTGLTHEGHESVLPVQLPGTDQPVDHYFNCVYQARHDEQGHIDGVLVFALDVTEQVQAKQRVAALQAEAQAAAERQAQERETFYQVFEHTPAVVGLLWGPEHRIAYANHTFMRLFPGRELRNRPAAEALPEAVPPGFVALLDHVYQSGESFVGTEIGLEIARPNGQPPRKVYLNFVYEAYRDNGQSLGISVFAYEVTEQVLARQQHEAQRRELEQLFMQAPSAICTLSGPELVYQLINPTYQRIFPGRVLQGKPLVDALPELRDTPILEICQQVYRTGEAYLAQEMPLHIARYEGEPLEDIFFTFTYQPRRNEQGTVDGIWVFAHEVTEQVRARQAMAESAQQAQALAQDLMTTNQQLTRTNNDLDTFIYTASHDLKAPIANIEGLLLLLRKQLPPAARQAGIVPRVLDMMQGSIERFQLTIAQLTDLAKLQQAHSQPPEEVDLPALVEAVRLDLAPRLEEAQVQLELNLDSCKTLCFAPQHLRSLLYNLLSNAIKYRHPDRPPVVQLRCRRLATATELEVQDNGLGLSPEQQSKLFSMFRRLHDHVPGSGVGLYMVKRIVENAGGTIKVASKPNAGSTFTISLPS